MDKETLCKKCQKCCKILEFVVDHPRSLKFYQTRGLDCVVDTRRQCVFVKVESVCQHLGPKGCKIYSKRPLDCVVFDGTKDPFLKNDCLWAKEEKKNG